jgi:hypothetical protein
MRAASVVLAGLVLFPACRSAGTPPAPAGVLGTMERTDGRYACMLTEAPEVLPEAGSLVDLPAFEAQMEELRRARRVDAGLVVFSMAYEPDGTNIRRAVLEHSTPPAFADSLQRLLFANLRPVAETEEGWGVRLQVEVGEGGARYEVGRRVYCPPVPRNPQLETAAIFDAREAGVRYRRGVRERVIVMRVRVQPNGFIDRAEIARGAPAGGSLERQLFDLVRQYAFFPATLDATPIPAWTEMPVIARDR